MLKALWPASVQLEDKITAYTMYEHSNYDDEQVALQASQTLCSFCLPELPTRGEGSGGAMRAAMGGGKQQRDPTAGNEREAAAPQKGKRREAGNSDGKESGNSKKRH